LASDTFLEIEHKFLVGRDFDKKRFLEQLTALSPDRQARVSVRDTYYVLEHDLGRVFRHRFDNEIQQLTVKTVERDAAVRTEVNIPIDQSKGDQRPAVSRFMKELGACWSGEVAKDIDVTYFGDCEVVFYRAVGRDKEVYCVEFEAVAAKTIQDGLATLETYERKLGFNPSQRETRSLFELLLVDDAPDAIKKMFI
jgi:adenylate cyclase class IV